MRPIIRGNRPVDNQGNEVQFLEYKEAKGELFSRIGRYCSYCETNKATLAVEHILPKKPESEVIKERLLNWDNFLLSCPNCNSTKGHVEIKLDDFLWPDRDNTFRALRYSEGGIVTPSFDGELGRKAHNTIKLFGLDKTPSIDPGDKHRDKASDCRWNDRRDAWNIATREKQKLSKNDDNDTRETVVKLALASGYWSTWMTVFEDDPDMCRRLIEAFPGTCKDCFDATQGYKPVKRQGGQC